jgi:hypothetical protein
VWQKERERLDLLCFTEVVVEQDVSWLEVVVENLLEPSVGVHVSHKRELF